MEIAADGCRNVQITLQILAALVEKAPRDLPLYAPYVLKILNIILKYRDITMVDLRLPDRVSVRLSDAAAQARDEVLKANAKKKKGGDA